MIAIGWIRLAALTSLIVLLTYGIGGGLWRIWRTRHKFPNDKSRFRWPK